MIIIKHSNQFHLLTIANSKNSPRTRKHFRTSLPVSQKRSLILFPEFFPHSVLQNDHQNASLQEELSDPRNDTKMFLKKDHSFRSTNCSPNCSPKRLHFLLLEMLIKKASLTAPQTEQFASHSVLQKAPKQHPENTLYQGKH